MNIERNTVLFGVSDEGGMMKLIADLWSGTVEQKRKSPHKGQNETYEFNARRPAYSRETIILGQHY